MRKGKKKKGRGQYKEKTRTSVAACTWLASEVTPNLTRLLLTLLAEELMELTDS